MPWRRLRRLVQRIVVAIVKIGKWGNEIIIVPVNIAIGSVVINFRRDEFYALITWVFNSPAFTDYMDEFMMVNVPDPNVPAGSFSLCQLVWK